MHHNLGRTKRFGDPVLHPFRDLRARRRRHGGIECRKRPTPKPDDYLDVNGCLVGNDDQAEDQDDGQRLGK